MFVLQHYFRFAHRIYLLMYQTEVESRTQGSKPRPRTALWRTDPLMAKDRNAQGQGKNQGHRRECSPKKRSTKFFFKKKVIFQTISKRRKKGPQKFFLGDLQKRKTKKVFAKFSARFLAFSNKILTVQKIVLFSSRGQGNFRGLEVSRPRPRTWPSRPRASKCVLEVVLDGNDVHKDSTFDTRWRVALRNKLKVIWQKRYKKLAFDTTIFVVPWA